MAYTVPTAADLKAMFPAFASVADETVTLYITRGNRNVDETWTEGDFANAIMLAAAHYMVLSGIGAGAEAQANAQGLSGFNLIRSGQLTLQRGSSSGSSGVPSEWVGSVYGQQYWALLRANRPRAVVANTGAPSLIDGLNYPPGSPNRLYPLG